MYPPFKAPLTLGFQQNCSTSSVPPPDARASSKSAKAHGGKASTDESEQQALLKVVLGTNPGTQTGPCHGIEDEAAAHGLPGLRESRLKARKNHANDVGHQGHLVHVEVQHREELAWNGWW